MLGLYLVINIMQRVFRHRHSPLSFPLSLHCGLTFFYLMKGGEGRRGVGTCSAGPTCQTVYMETWNNHMVLHAIGII